MLELFAATKDTQGAMQMPTTNNPRTLGSVAGSILIVVVISLSGCTTMRPDAEGEDSFMPDWGGALRLPAANSDITGLSDTSRQIERNLGFE